MGVILLSDDFRPGPGATRHSRVEQRAYGDRGGDGFRQVGLLQAGLVLHTGQWRLPFGDRLMALPVSDLWS
jgi:hypothetical protein